MELLVEPVGRRISVTSGGNLLSVLREHDVPISYSCTSGRCGSCRCKVVKGHVKDERLSHAARGRDEAYILACQSTLIEDVVIEIQEPDEIVVHPARTLKGTVADIEWLSASVIRLVLRTNKPMSFSPGQYANLTFGQGLERPYSMAGLPDDDLMEFHIRIVPNGKVSSYVAHQLAVGDTVKVAGPLGGAYLRKKHVGPILCVAGGTGLAPVLSILRGTLQGEMPNPIHLYIAAPTEKDLYGLEDVHRIAERHPALSVIPMVLQGSAGKGIQSGLVTDEILRRHANLGDWSAYLCGSPALVEATAMLAERLGLPWERIYADAFYPAMP